MAYYAYKDKGAGRLIFQYQIGEIPAQIEVELANEAMEAKRRFKGRKVEVLSVDVPFNPALEAMGTELNEIIKASYHKFESLQNQKSPWGKLALVFSSLTVRESFLTLSVPFSGRQSVSYPAILLRVARKILPTYRVTMDGKTIKGFINEEYPSFKILVNEDTEKIEWTFKWPEKRDAPEMIFNFEQLLANEKGPDTLVSIKVKSGKQSYVIGTTDQSGIDDLKFNGEKSATKVVTILIAIVPAW